MQQPIHAVILASGLSHRLEGFNKLLLPCPGGKQVAGQVLSAVALAKGFSSKQLVYSDAAVAHLACEYGCTAVYNVGFAEGKAAGIRLAAQTANEGGLLFIAADQGGVDSPLLESIIEKARKGADVVFTRAGENFGLPAFFSARLRPFLADISGEQGGKDALCRYEAEHGKAAVTFVDTDKSRYADIDTWSDYLDFLEQAGIRHLLITGERSAGKSTLIRAITKTTGADGLLLYVNRAESETENYLYIERMATGEKRLAARLRKSDKSLLNFDRATFDDFAACQLAAAAKNPGKRLLVIDELGRLEAECEAFHNAVRKLLENGKTRVLAALQSGDIAFNRELASRSDVMIFEVKR